MVESLQGSLPVAISGTSAAANLIAFAFAIPVAAQSTHVTEFNISRCAVDRSQGRLLDLTLPGSHLDALLNYVADRSSQLRCLKLVEYLRNYEGGSTPLTLHITKLQQLEELHLVMKPWVDLEDFETIGIACPMLKSFTYHNCLTKGPDFREYVAAIGKPCLICTISGFVNI